jgi:hypothetical protein
MKLTSPFKDFTNAEYCLLGLFLVYLVIPFRTPHMLYKMFVSPPGLILLLCLAVAGFFMMPPILAIMFVLVIYELLRRDGSDGKTYQNKGVVSDNTTQEYKYVSDPVIKESVQSKGEVLGAENTPAPSQPTKREEVYLPVGDSLEESVVATMAPRPLGESKTSSDFKPISESVIPASVF